MIIIKQSLTLGLGLILMLLLSPTVVQADPLRTLLEQVKQGRVKDAELHAQRLREFTQQQSRQQEMLDQISAEQRRLEESSAQREERFESNEQEIAQLRERLQERLGTLKELFGVLQQVAGDTNAQFANSITQLHFPERSAFLQEFSQKMGQVSELPSIREIEQLWFELQRDIAAAGEVLAFQHPVLTSTGQEEQANLVRIGSFSLINKEKFHQYIPETGRVVEYGRQPAQHYRDNLGALERAETGEYSLVSIDPTRGQLLSLLVKAPNLQERIAQGGIIGYAIITLGCFAFLMALYRLLVLFNTQRQISAQINSPEQITDNPLGRILAVYDSNKNQSTETLEFKLGEAILREVPRVNRGIPLLKIIAAVAPLMGLLGTVAGMIITFQAITLFGAGDPKLMAGGISQALITTVLGLTVAIPTLLLHNLLSTRAERINAQLEQEGMAIVAERSENHDVSNGLTA